MTKMGKRITDGLTGLQRYRLRHPDYNEKSRKCNRKATKKVKEEIYNILGGKCSNPSCLVPNGCIDIRCLQIDHINGNGQKERKKFQANYLNYYRYVLEQLKTSSKDYQLLCATCNWIKRYEKKEWKRR